MAQFDAPRRRYIVRALLVSLSTGLCKMHFKSGCLVIVLFQTHVLTLATDATKHAYVWSPHSVQVWRLRA